MRSKDLLTGKDHEAIRAILDATGYHGSTDNLPSKARAVALYKDAHIGKDDTLLFMLSATKDVLWHNNDVSINIYKIVKECGIASILVKVGDNWVTNEPIGLVENKDLLVHATRYFKKINSMEVSFIIAAGCQRRPFPG